METLKVGLIGVGNIAPTYIRGCAPFDSIDVTACADILIDRAEAFAAEHGMTAHSVDDLLARDDIDIVINLTIPAVHAEVSLQIIAAGKHTYSEKPLALNRADGEKIVKAAAAAGLRLGCAPDTFLGGGGQTARKAIDDGMIGAPIAATAFFLSHGPEAWHPNAGFFLSQRRRTALRYGSLFSDGAGQFDGTGGAGGGLGAEDLFRAHRHK